MTLAFCTSFALSNDEPTSLFVSFYANGIRYDYLVTYNRKAILHELLNWYPNEAKALFYERQFVSDDSRASIKFGGSLGLLAGTKEAFIQNTLNNHSVLSVFGKIAFDNDAQCVANLYKWMTDYMHEVNILETSLADTLKIAENDKDAKRFILQLLRKADFNIIDFYTETVSERVPSHLAREIEHDSEGNTVRYVTVERVRVYFVCQAGDKTFTLGYDEQSEGTKKFLANLSILYSAIVGNHVFLIDEIDTELHDDLLLYFLNVFVLNSQKSQLIFTTHETSLLNEDLLNTHRDFVFVAEKNRSGAYSEYTRADEFGLHKNLSLYKSYRIGRLGAVPQLGSPIIYKDYEED